MFPNGVSLQIVQVLGLDNIKIEIWQKDSGYTETSGICSAAASCVAFKLGLIKNKATVHMPGGQVQVEIGPEYAYLTSTDTRSIRDPKRQRAGQNQNVWIEIYKLIYFKLF